MPEARWFSKSRKIVARGAQSRSLRGALYLQQGCCHALFDLIAHPVGMQLIKLAANTFFLMHLSVPHEAPQREAPTVIIDP